MSLIAELHRAQAKVLGNQDDPWRGALERALPRNVMCTSTVALLNLLDFPVTTGNARRLARTMRALGWVGIAEVAAWRLAQHRVPRLVTRYRNRG
jgi:hypothetical protein